MYKGIVAQANSVSNDLNENASTYSVFTEHRGNKVVAIFDFDDTLFCTKYFDTYSLNYQEIFSFKTCLEETNSSLSNELKELEGEVLQLFSAFLEANIEIYIVSNADKKWIENCLLHFLPELKDFIEENNVQIFSAKNLFYKVCTTSIEWKKKCFESIVQKFYAEFKECFSLTLPYELKIIGIGDSFDEKNATYQLLNLKEFPRLKVKFIQMISCPSAASIIMQLKFLRNSLDEFLKESEEFYKLKVELCAREQRAEVKCIKSKYLKDEFEDEVVEEPKFNFQSDSEEEDEDEENDDDIFDGKDEDEMFKLNRNPFIGKILKTQNEMSIKNILENDLEEDESNNFKEKNEDEEDEKEEDEPAKAFDQEDNEDDEQIDDSKFMAHYDNLKENLRNESEDVGFILDENFSQKNFDNFYSFNNCYEDNIFKINNKKEQGQKLQSVLGQKRKLID